MLVFCNKDNEIEQCDSEKAVNIYMQLSTDQCMMLCVEWPFFIDIINYIFLFCILELGQESSSSLSNLSKDEVMTVVTKIATA